MGRRVYLGKLEGSFPHCGTSRAFSCPAAAGLQLHAAGGTKVLPHGLTSHQPGHGAGRSGIPARDAQVYVPSEPGADSQQL